ncbi:hypothetical protein LHJ74_31675 [Streptomyces sp. N2-109]|uniref:RING-type domain-containing protein n=1 Tax=Streptomyces gossypii TaxID=2883101 RepID=A0ABT2K369_9ACTN|nr:MXAN_6230/SCO0854 family RING domain-containing protein [Streptomyces gossypii]MCT2594416.1 hypothetical protein [Streptomyces gossypii]
MTAEDVEKVLFRRRQSVFLEPAPARPPYSRTPGSSRTADGLTALDAELAARGHLLTAALRQALGALPAADLAHRGRQLLADIDALLGADRTHTPLFRHFPDGVPREDAHSLYTSRIRAHLAAQPHQPCMACGLPGPGVAPVRGCGHLACRRCWEAAPWACCEECCEWSGCPVCEERFRTDGPCSPWSPLPAARAHHQPAEAAEVADPVLRVLRLAPSREEASRQELAVLLARRTPLSPQDHDDLYLLLAHVGTEGGLEWLPEEIPLRESKALALDVLLARPEDFAVRAEALRARLDTATDILRLLCVRSGGDPDLLSPPPRAAPLPRPLRRLLLEILDGLRFAALAEDLARHPEQWKRAAERLHPFEYAARFPRAALAFAALRGTDATSGDALSELLMAEAAHHPEQIRLAGDQLRLTTWASRVESALAAYDVDAAARLLAARPGELLRRLSHLLDRAAASGGELPEAVTEALARALPSVAPGPLLGALGVLRARTAHGGAARGAGARVGGRAKQDAAAPRRVFFPRASLTRAHAVPERRLPLPAKSTDAVCALIEAEILDRLTGPGASFGSLPGAVAAPATGDRREYDAAVLDAGLADLPVPAAERGVSASLVAIPRGSTLPMPGGGARVRLFLHWTQPRATRVDLDLSVAMYDAQWRFVGLCDYTRLEYAGGAAVHSGDYTSAPPPHGATEYVDLDLPGLARAGVRHLVTVVLSYNDVPFEELPDAFSGFMKVGEEHDGKHRHGPSGQPPRRTARRVRTESAGAPARYDVRTVRQRFDLLGDAKICVPMVIDLATRQALWTDVTLESDGTHHDVWRYRNRLARLGHDLTDAFGGGARVTLWDVACWHAAARTRAGAPVLVRSEGKLLSYRRGMGESAYAFAVRLREGLSPDGMPSSVQPLLADAGHVFGALVHADLTGLPPAATGTVYRLYPGTSDASALDRVTPGDLVAGLAPRQEVPA